MCSSDLVAKTGGNDSYSMYEAAAQSAFAAYMRASTRANEADALALLAKIYEERSYWRQSLAAYRASLERADVAAVRAAYEPLREKYGFRVLNEKTDSDSATPRVCFEFSEQLARGRVDFAPYVVVSGASNVAVTTEAQQLCVEGLKHGERYKIVLRQGLPSAVGENLLRAADYEIGRAHV